MHLSLPSASARVRSLEHHAGVALLIRGRRGVRPTPAGATLARHARDVLSRTARLESAVASYTRSPTAPLTLLVGGSAMHRLVPQALISFLRAHPDTDVAVSESRTPRTVRMLADGEADLGVVLDDETRDGRLRTEPLGDDSLVVIGQAGGILAGRTAPTAKSPSIPLSGSMPTPRCAVGSKRTSVPRLRWCDTGPLSPTWAFSSPSPQPASGSPWYRAAPSTPTNPSTSANWRTPGLAATSYWPGESRTAPRRRRPPRSPNTCATRLRQGRYSAGQTRTQTRTQVQTPTVSAPSLTADRASARARYRTPPPPPLTRWPRSSCPCPLREQPGERGRDLRRRAGSDHSEQVGSGVDIGEILDGAEVVTQGVQHRGGLKGWRWADRHAENPEA